MFLRFLDTLFVRYGNTSGRADRVEFWCFHFFNLILIGGLCVLTLFLAGTLGDSLWAYLCSGFFCTFPQDTANAAAAISKNFFIFYCLKG